MTTNTECVETPLLHGQTPCHNFAHAAGFSARHRWLFFFLFVFFILGLSANAMTLLNGYDYPNNLYISSTLGTNGIAALSAIVGMLVAALVVQLSSLQMRLYWTLSLFMLLFSFVFYIVHVYTGLAFGIRFGFSYLLTAVNAGGVVSSLTFLVWATRVDRCAFWLVLAAAWATEWISGTSLVTLFYWLVAFAPSFWMVMVGLFIGTLLLLKGLYNADLNEHLDKLHNIQQHAPKASLFRDGLWALYLFSLFYFYGSFRYYVAPPRLSSYWTYYYAFVFALLLGVATIPRMAQTRGWRMVAVWGISMNLVSFAFSLGFLVAPGNSYAVYSAMTSLNIIFWTLGTTFMFTSLFAMARNLVPGRSLVWVFAFIFSIAYITGILGQLPSSLSSEQYPVRLGLSFGLPFALCILSLISMFFLPPAAQGPQIA